MPKGNHFEVQITHESALTDRLNFSPLLDKSRACGIDLGINNLLTLVTNQPDVSPVLIKGGSLKSINAKYNKDAGELRSNEKFAHLKARGARRHRQVSDILHKASRAVIDFCLNNDLGTLVIGKNKDFKQNINIGRVNNQKFVSIPHARLIDLIVYKASKQNIKVTVREESYTSKASSLDFDEIPSYSVGVKNKIKFSGKRVKRGLYKTRDALLNADVNGALNILRKELGDASLSLIDKGCVTQPRTLYCQNAREPRIALC